MKNDNNPKKMGRLTLEMVKNLGVGSDLSNENEENSITEIQGSLNQLNIAETMQTKVLQMPKLNMLELTYSQIKALSDEDLIKLLSGEGHNSIIREPTIQLISNELLSRQIKEASKPHWTVTPTFIVASIAAIGTILSVYLSLR